MMRLLPVLILICQFCVDITFGCKLEHTMQHRHRMMTKRGRQGREVSGKETMCKLRDPRRFSQAIMVSMQLEAEQGRRRKRGAEPDLGDEDPRFCRIPGHPIVLKDPEPDPLRPLTPYLPQTFDVDNLWNADCDQMEQFHLHMIGYYHYYHYLYHYYYHHYYDYYYHNYYHNTRRSAKQHQKSGKNQEKKFIIL